MDIAKLCIKLEKGPVYLKDDYEDAVLRIISTGHGARHYLRRRGRKEIEVSASDKDVFEMTMSGREISKEEYGKFH